MISPVVSSAVCEDCHKENLTDPVAISFNATNEVTTSVAVINNDVYIFM